MWLPRGLPADGTRTRCSGELRDDSFGRELYGIVPAKKRGSANYPYLLFKHDMVLLHGKAELRPRWP